MTEDDLTRVHAAAIGAGCTMKTADEIVATLRGDSSAPPAPADNAKWASAMRQLEAHTTRWTPSRRRTTPPAPARTVASALTAVDRAVRVARIAEHSKDWTREPASDDTLDRMCKVYGHVALTLVSDFSRARLTGQEAALLLDRNVIAGRALDVAAVAAVRHQLSFRKT